MAIRLIPFLVFLFAVAALAIAASGRLRSGQSIPPDPSRGRRRIVRWGFGLIGITLAVASAFSLGQRAIFLIAPLAISGYVAGLLLGELMMPNAQSGPVRRVSLDRRVFERYVQTRWIWVWRAAAGRGRGPGRWNGWQVTDHGVCRWDAEWRRPVARVVLRRASSHGAHTRSFAGRALNATDCGEAAP